MSKNKHGNHGLAERSQRQLRIAERVRRIAIDYLSREFFTHKDLQDPSSVTVTEVQVSPDLRSATAFIMPLAGANADKVVKALNSERNRFTHFIAKNLETKNSPRISFLLDTTFDEVDKINALLDRS